MLTRATALFAACALAAPAPADWSYELMVRSNFAVNGGGYRLPPDTFFANATPALSATGQVAVKLDVVDASEVQGLWLGTIGGAGGGIVFTTPFGAVISDPTLNNLGAAVFEQGFSASDGIWLHDSNVPTTTLRTTLPTGATDWGTPRINDAQEIGFRAGIGFGGRALVSIGPANDVATHAEEAGLDAGSPYSYLFTPDFNLSRDLAAKARLGSAGQTGDERPDIVAIFHDDGSRTIIARDVDSLASSPYDGFDNSVGLNDNGAVAFIATLVGGGRAVLLGTGGAPITIASESDPDVSEIEFFPPDVNALGQVVFRAKDGAGLRAVFVGDGTSLGVVVREHDLLPSDLGEARVDQHDASPVFGGAPTINDAGQVAFHCGLTPPANDQVEWGSGIYVAYPVDGGPDADVNDDGVVDVADLVAVILAWGTGPGPADVNNDGVVDVADLVEVILAWS